MLKSQLPGPQNVIILGDFKEVIAEKFPNLEKEPDAQVYETKRTPNSLNAKRPLSRYIILKLSKASDRVLKTVKVKKKKSNLQRNSH